MSYYSVPDIDIDPNGINFPKERKLIYFLRTRDQYRNLLLFAKQMSEEAEIKHGLPTLGFLDSDYLRAHVPIEKLERVWNKVPKSNPGKKKYEVHITIDERLYQSAGEEILKGLQQLGLVPHEGPKEPKYKDSDLTKKDIIIKTVDQFKSLTKEMNKQYGHGNWHLRGVSKILRKLHNIEMFRERPTQTDYSRNSLTVDQVQNGLKLTVTVIGEAPTLERVLFKIQLIG